MGTGQLVQCLALNSRSMVAHACHSGTQEVTVTLLGEYGAPGKRCSSRFPSVGLAWSKCGFLFLGRFPKVLRGGHSGLVVVMAGEFSSESRRPQLGSSDPSEVPKEGPGRPASSRLGGALVSGSKGGDSLVVREQPVCVCQGSHIFHEDTHSCVCTCVC